MIQIIFNNSLGFDIILFWFLALNKVFKFADVEESGKVDVATIATLAVQLMGGDFNEAEKELVNKKAEVKAENGRAFCSSISIRTSKSTSKKHFECH